MWNVTVACDGKNADVPCQNTEQSIANWQPPVLVAGPKGPGIMGGTAPPATRIPDKWGVVQPSNLSMAQEPVKVLCPTCFARHKAEMA